MIFKPTLLLFILLSGFLQAQQVSPNVINATGTSFQNSQMGLTFNVGELAVTKISSSGNIITQGFLQPLSNPILIKENENSNNYIVFPNPSNNQITIRSSNNLEGKLKVKIVDAIGKTVLNEELITNTISLDNYPNGVYQLIITDEKNNISYKTITKIN